MTNYGGYRPALRGFILTFAGDKSNRMIHYFNPGHETAVLNASPYYMYPANVAAMQHELAYLPAWYARRDDRVLVRNAADKEYADFLSGYFGALPEAILQEDTGTMGNEEICLWGISPQAIHLFGRMNEEYGINLSVPSWNDRFVYLNSRQSARDCLSRLSDAIPQVSGSLLPRIYTALDEVEAAVTTCQGQLLAKAPYSSSGRGLLWLPIGGLTRTERQILHGIVKKQGAVLVERVVDKQIDFAMEFMCDGQGGVDFGGYSLFETNNKGAYAGNRLMGQADIEVILTAEIGGGLMEDVKRQLMFYLSSEYAPYYRGCVGVDMMLYGEGSEVRIHPCVEINMRYNMGYLTLKLFENYIKPSAKGWFYLDFSPKEGEMYRLHQELKDKYPVIVEDGRMGSGYLPLCAVTPASRYRAYVLIDGV